MNHADEKRHWILETTPDSFTLRAQRDGEYASYLFGLSQGLASLALSAVKAGLESGEITPDEAKACGAEIAKCFEWQVKVGEMEGRNE